MSHTYFVGEIMHFFRKGSCSFFLFGKKYQYNFFLILWCELRRIRCLQTVGGKKMRKIENYCLLFVYVPRQYGFLHSREACRRCSRQHRRTPFRDLFLHVRTHKHNLSICQCSIKTVISNLWILIFMGSQWVTVAYGYMFALNINVLAIRQLKANIEKLKTSSRSWDQLKPKEKYVKDYLSLAFP